MPRRPTTPRVRAAAHRNIKKAQISRIRLRETRSVGRILSRRLRGRIRVRRR